MSLLIHSGRNLRRIRLLPGRVLLAFLFLVILSLGACSRISSGAFNGDVNGLVTEGRAYLAELSSRPADHLADHEVIALGYAERARLGLGSPFRLIEYALRDPDLPDETRTLVAYGILSRALDGATYFVDPRVLERARLGGITSALNAGTRQLELIEEAVSGAPTVMAGERTVRLGYLLTASDGTADPVANTIVAHVAAMIGDRRRAREDASRLLRTARNTHEDPLTLLEAWRRELRFSVEQPRMVPVTMREEEAEARNGPIFAMALRSLAQRLGSPTTLVDESADGEDLNSRPFLEGHVAERLRALSSLRDYPAQAPVAVAVEINRDGLSGGMGLTRVQRLAREEFVGEAWNEEKLAAGAGVLTGMGADVGDRLSLVLLQAATFLRVWNQEEPWFPGDPAPAVREMEARFGISSISFDDGLPDSWRSYYLRMLARSLTELQRVLPRTSVRGVEIVIGKLPGDAQALALHEPGSRTLYLPPRSGAGTIAHELAHDLDWQLARRRYVVRGGYATDMAVRDNRGDRIAAAMMELSASLVQPDLDDESMPRLGRPAEVFARGTDWLVAAVLARDGRLGGYLTSFQDPVLTGYGTTRGPDISGAAVPALLAILDEVSPVPEPAREWVLNRYGPSRTLMGSELAGAVIDAGRDLPLEARLQKIHDAGLRLYQAVGDCGFSSAAGIRRLTAAQHTLADVSLGAATRGAAVDAIRSLATEFGGVYTRRAADAWITRRLGGAPGGLPDPAIVELVPAFEEYLTRAETAGKGGGPAGQTAFRPRNTPSLCGGNPFAADTPVDRFRNSAGRAGL
ncbi:MAG: hypothetical protein LBG44_06325 [Gemmatimonadota bacterium]|jgi:hypothetical protein|nr:hypothetical protein [Gemmatimonadota bacterium]